MIKRIMFGFLFLALFISIAPNASASKINNDNNREVVVFSSPTCPHCTTASIFLDDLISSGNYSFEIVEYNLSQNTDLVKDYYDRYQVPNNRQGLVPAIFIADSYFIGFNDQTKINILAILDEEDVVSDNLVTLPFMGEVDLMTYSLPALAITLGIVDGFNVCSLGALVIILGLVMVLRSRKKIILLGGTFVLTTAIIYGLLIFLWHKFFSAISPYIRSFEMMIGLLALVGGIYLLREFYKAYKSGPVCSTNNLMTRITPKIEKVFKNKTNWFALLSAVFMFAVVVTIVEFPCSAFLPVLFTSILVEAGISGGQSIAYIMLYMLFYLLDEIIIFLIAVFTMRIKIVSPRFIIFFNLLAALIFLFLGIYYIFGFLS